jgi:hypothetical protein
VLEKLWRIILIPINKLISVDLIVILQPRISYKNIALTSSYDLIFHEIRSELCLINETSHQEFLFEADIVMTDFELSLINSVQKKMQGSQQKCCYFHWLQALWRYAGKIRMRTKEIVSKTREIIMALSLLCFLNRTNLKSCFEVIRSHYLTIFKEEAIKQFFDYWYLSCLRLLSSRLTHFWKPGSV